MCTSSDSTASTLWKRLGKIYNWGGMAIAVLILLILPIGIFSDSMAMACRNDSYESHQKLRYCNMSLITRTWIHFSPLMLARSSSLHLERGIALSQVGREEDALIAFEQAIKAAGAKPGSWTQKLQTRMEEIDADRPTTLWNSLVQKTLDAEGI